MKFRVNGSITDFPLYTSLKTYFYEFKQTGVDGVEVVGGYKNRWAFGKLFSLSKEYNLPIISFHQPMWSGLGIFLDEAFFREIIRHNVRKVTFHPLAFTSFSNKFMQRYFKRLSTIQETYGISLLLENMPPETEYKKLFNGSNHRLVDHLETVYELGEEYGFSLTYDVSHGELVYPQKEKIFQKMFSRISIIHLSSFAKNGHHLPLYEGKFDTKKFLTFLKEKRFQGDIVLEINDSILRRIFTPYDFGAIAKSVAIIRDIEKK